MSDEAEKEFKRLCPLCNAVLASLKDHSIGWFHAVCMNCDFCPDCDDGAV